MKCTVLIPSYNESESIGEIVKKVRSIGFSVLVIDDGSRDNTKLNAAKEGADVISNTVNLGKGASLKLGFRKILACEDMDAVIVMDGDGQHDPDDIKSLIKKAEDTGKDLVIGNRMERANNMPLIRLLTNRFMSWLLSSLCGQKIDDTQCGFRLIRRGVLSSVILESNNYDLESEILVKASRKGFKIASVPIKAVYKGEVSSINPVKDTIRFIALIIKLTAKR